MTLSISTTTQPIASPEIPGWQKATWEDYLTYRDVLISQEARLFFNNNCLFIDMGNEGINHAAVARLFAMLFAFWFTRFSQQTASDIGGC